MNPPDSSFGGDTVVDGALARPTQKPIGAPFREIRYGQRIEVLKNAVIATDKDEPEFWPGDLKILAAARIVQAKPTTRNLVKRIGGMTGHKKARVSDSDLGHVEVSTRNGVAENTFGSYNSTRLAAGGARNVKPTLSVAAKLLFDGVQRLTAQMTVGESRVLVSAIEKLAPATPDRRQVPEALRGLVGEPLSQPDRVALSVAGVQRGLQQRADIVKVAVDARDVAAKLGTSPRTVLDRRKAGKLFGVRSNQSWLFPLWQFDPGSPDGVLEGLQAIVGELAHLRSWDQAIWLSRANPSLEGRSPIEVLRAGDLDPEVLALLARGTNRA